MFLAFSNLKSVILEDELNGIVFLSQWLYKSKYVRLLCYCYCCVCIGYFCLFLNYASKEWEHLVSVDIVVAALAIEVICVFKVYLFTHL